MKKLGLAGIVLGMALGATAVKANVTLADFNGTGFANGDAFGTWSGNVAIGATFVTIAGSATEGGNANTFFAPVNLSGLDIALTAQLGAGNQADGLEFQLIDESGARMSVFNSWGAFNESTMNTLRMTPSVPVGFDITKVTGFELKGDFGTSPLHVLVDDVSAVSPVPEASAYGMWGVGLLGVIAALRRRKNVA